MIGLRTAASSLRLVFTHKCQSVQNCIRSAELATKPEPRRRTQFCGLVAQGVARNRASTGLSVIPRLRRTKMWVITRFAQIAAIG